MSISLHEHLSASASLCSHTAFTRVTTERNVRFMYVRVMNVRAMHVNVRGMKVRRRFVRVLPPVTTEMHVRVW